MPIKYICSNRPLKPNERRDNPISCFRKGLRVGYVAGLNKVQNQTRTQTPMPSPIAPRSTPIAPRSTPRPQLQSLASLERQMGEKKEYRSGTKILKKAIVVDIYKKYYPNSVGKNKLRSASYPVGTLRTKLIEDGYFLP